MGLEPGGPQTSVAGTKHHPDSAWLAEGSAISIVGGSLGRVFQIASQAVLARSLGPAEFGLYTIGWALLRTVGMFATLGLDSGVVHYGSRLLSQPALLRRIMRSSTWLTLGIGSLSGAALGVLAPILALRMFGKEQVTSVIFGFAIGLPLFAGLRVSAAATRASQRMRYSVYAEAIGQPASCLILILLFFYLGFGLMGAVAATVASYGFGLGVALLYQRQLFGGRDVKETQAASPVYELLSFSVPASIGITLANLEVWFDRLAVGAFLAPRQVGIYQAAAQTAMAIGMIGGSFNVVFSSRISLLYGESETERLDELYKAAARWAVYAVTPFFLALCLSPSNVLGGLYGGGYSAGALVLILLCFAEVFDLAVGPAGSLLVFTQHQGILALVSGSGLVAAVVLCILLIPRFGLIGAASATAVGSFGIELAKLLAVRRKIGLWPFDRRWLKGLAATAGTLVVLILSRVTGLKPQWFGLVATLALSGVVFASCLVLLGLESEEIEVLALARLRLRALTRGLAIDVK